MTTTVISSSTTSVHTKREGRCKAKASTLLQLMVLSALVLGIADCLIYFPILQAEGWTSSAHINNVMAIVLSAIPVALACLIVLPVSGLRKKVSPFAIIAIIVLLGFEVYFFYNIWQLRSSGEGSALLSNVLNVTGIIICVVAFGLHLWLSKKRELLNTEARIHRLRAEHNDNLRLIAPFKQTRAIDYQRRSHDYESFLAALSELPKTCILNMDLSRACCAERKGEHPDDLYLATALPYHFNNKDHADALEAERAIIDYLDMPSEEGFHTAYGPVSNPTLDERAANALEDFQERYEDIVRKHDGVED